MDKNQQPPSSKSPSAGQSRPKVPSSALANSLKFNDVTMKGADVIAIAGALGIPHSGRVFQPEDAQKVRDWVADNTGKFPSVADAISAIGNTQPAAHSSGQATSDVANAEQQQGGGRLTGSEIAFSANPVAAAINQIDGQAEVSPFMAGLAQVMRQEREHTSGAEFGILIMKLVENGELCEKRLLDPSSAMDTDRKHRALDDPNYVPFSPSLIALLEMVDSSQELQEAAMAVFMEKVSHMQIRQQRPALRVTPLTVHTVECAALPPQNRPALQGA